MFFISSYQCRFCSYCAEHLFSPFFRFASRLLNKLKRVRFPKQMHQHKQQHDWFWYKNYFIVHFCMFMSTQKLLEQCSASKTSRILVFFPVAKMFDATSIVWCMCKFGHWKKLDKSSNQNTGKIFFLIKPNTFVRIPNLWK